MLMTGGRSQEDVKASIDEHRPRMKPQRGKERMRMGVSRPEGQRN